MAQHASMRYLVVLSLIFLLFNSCRKPAVCKGNCVDIRITGRMYDAVQNIGIANQAMNVTWSHTGMCFFCPSTKVGSSRTDNNGNFDFTIRIDSSFFSSNHLSLRIAIPQGYINNGFTELQESMYSYNGTGFMNLSYPMYPKADLFLRLHRTGNDQFTYFTVNHSYIPNHTWGDYSLTSPANARDTIIQVPTAAGVWTRIVWLKNFGPGNNLSQQDSIFCTKQGPNNFDLYY